MLDAPPSPAGEGLGVGLTPLETYGRITDPSGLALNLLHRVSTKVWPAHKHVFQQCLQCVFRIETQGRQQSADIPAVDEIAHITASKGGSSVLLFRCLLPDSLPETERLALFEFGHLVQLSDDIFDLWHDLQTGTATMATRLASQGDCAQLGQVFEDQAARVVEVFRKIQTPGSQRETALHTVFFLVAITRVCLRHYQYLQKKRGTLPLNHRRALVVDMARWKFRWRVVAALLDHRTFFNRTP
ncbi:MAG: hypothetical protein ACKVU2_18495 [Saprospiraceae bacterium]